jgi:hypothetical protein
MSENGVEDGMCNAPGLYGLVNSNRNFEDPYYWGKNQFNSSFPAALSCYMRDQGHSAVYIRHVADKQTETSEISFAQVFGSELLNEQLFFSFEDSYQPFGAFVRDSLKPIDLIVKNNETGEEIRPLEIKLTVLPDDSTSGREESEYGAELVIRTPTMRYMAMSMAEACLDRINDVRDIFSPVCGRIRHWDVVDTMKSQREAVFDALETFIEEFREHQRPMLMQPVWKTLGKSSALAEQCLDVFVWSDFALTRLFMDSATVVRPVEARITRQQRAAFRLARFLYELSASQEHKVFQEPIYDGMNFGVLNDKEFSISGSKTNRYLSCDRLIRPIISKEEIKNIILGELAYRFLEEGLPIQEKVFGRELVRCLA